MNNDETIKTLLSKITEKRSALKTVKIPSYKSNCFVDKYVRASINIHTLTTIDSIVELYAELNQKYTALLQAATTLKVNDETVTSNLSRLAEWLFDLQVRKDKLVYQTELKDLDAMEKTVSNLLSADTKTALELDRIGKLLS